ncbi:hypothetical protein [Crenobacter caeni]|nr:hypothetical protein [Crenobacter caeni]
MAMELLDLNDEAARELRKTGWIIKCPFFRNGQAVFVAVKVTR